MFRHAEDLEPCFIRCYLSYTIVRITQAPISGTRGLNNHLLALYHGSAGRPAGATFPSLLVGAIELRMRFVTPHSQL